MTSLYSLEPKTSLHRDTLERLCARRRDPIQVYFLTVSTDRYLKRAIEDEDVPRLLRAAAKHRRKRRKVEAARRPSGPVPPLGPGWPYRPQPNPSRA